MKPSVDKASNAEHLRVANESGFPLQIAVQHAVSSRTQVHGWKVAHVEHAWTNRDDEKSGFIDLVLQDRHGFASLVLECKRVRDATWLFLNTKGSPVDRYHCKAWATHYRSPDFRTFGWVELPVEPATPEAQFCAVRGNNSNDQNTFLEKIASTLISSTEALACEECDYRDKGSESIRAYFNVIVTTAQLAVASFDVSDLSITDGTLSRAQFTDVPYVRVRKQFSLRPQRLSPKDWESQENTDYRRENTVFVVRADKLDQFLCEFNVPDSSLRQFRG